MISSLTSSCGIVLHFIIFGGRVGKWCRLIQIDGRLIKPDVCGSSRKATINWTHSSRNFQPNPNHKEGKTEDNLKRCSSKRFFSAVFLFILCIASKCRHLIGMISTWIDKFSHSVRFFLSGPSIPSEMYRKTRCFKGISHSTASHQCFWNFLSSPLKLNSLFLFAGYL